MCGDQLRLKLMISIPPGAITVGEIESDPAKGDGRLKPGDQIIEVC